MLNNANPFTSTNGKLFVFILSLINHRTKKNIANDRYLIWNILGIWLTVFSERNRNEKLFSTHICKSPLRH